MALAEEAATRRAAKLARQREEEQAILAARPGRMLAVAAWAVWEKNAAALQSVARDIAIQCAEAPEVAEVAALLAAAEAEGWAA